MNKDTKIALIIVAIWIGVIIGITYEGDRPLADIVQNSTMKIITGENSSGSAFVWDDKYIITAAHCLKSKGEVKILVFGEEFKAEVVGFTEINNTDVGVLRIPFVLRGHLKGIERDKTPLGYLDPIVLISSPLGLPVCVTKGVVSDPSYAMGSIADGRPMFAKIDAAANAGSSGGVALRNGKAVGLLTRGVAHGMGIAWIIKIDVIERAVAEIIAKGGGKR